ncbi:MAG TPA: hypothetical protein VM580_09960 [Labilithrix sp.]|nr:hypothetical protein [Labilithrix sp.]
MGKAPWLLSILTAVATFAACPPGPMRAMARALQLTRGDKGPDSDIAAQCKESGYRVEKVVGADGIATRFKADQAQELGKVAANLRALGMKVKAKKEPAEKALLKSLTDACASGQTSIRLGVTARLHCKRVKPGLGDANKEYVSDEVIATFKLTCQ